MLLDLWGSLLYLLSARTSRVPNFSDIRLLLSSESDFHEGNEDHGGKESSDADVEHRTEGLAVRTRRCWLFDRAR